jgi:hypothetical protein
MEFGEIAMVHVDSDTSVKSARKQYYRFFKALAKKCGSKIPKKKLKLQARDAVSKMHAHLNCPEVNQKVDHMRCHVCAYGHMTECHYPYRCSDPKAKCSHYEEYANQSKIDFMETPWE